MSAGGYYFAIGGTWHALAPGTESIIFRAACGAAIPPAGPGKVTRDEPFALCFACEMREGLRRTPEPPAPAPTVRDDLHDCPGGCGKKLAPTVGLCMACWRRDQAEKRAG